MSPIQEQLKRKITALPDNEQYDLYADLRERFEPDNQDGSADVTLSVEWKQKIESRLDDITLGRVKLIPGDGDDRDINAFLPGTI